MSNVHKLRQHNPHKGSRLRASSLDQHGRRETRMHRVAVWPDSQAAEESGADPVCDDQAERHSAWGSLPECAAEGGKHREPVATAARKAWAPFCSSLLLICAWFWAEHRATLVTAGAAFAGVIGWAVWVRWPVVGG